MPIDHSLTYRNIRPRNIPHIFRLKRIQQVVIDNCPSGEIKYADIGCSNGYITNIVSNLISASSTVGFDRTDNLIYAKENYPTYSFQYIDLNKNNKTHKFNLVTCFETLEHVGDIGLALDNLLNMTDKNGVLIVSVPIEIGAFGVMKYLVKRLIYRYSLPLNCNDVTYYSALIKGSDISKFRIKSDGYGSHFGFDYRVIDYLLSLNPNVEVKSWNSFTTRFYVIRV